MKAAGLVPMLLIQMRTSWKPLTAWIVALGAVMFATTLSISDLYDTQAKIDGYAKALQSGNTLEAINGNVYGLGSLGGVIANEFGFIASCALPLMGISLVARVTRRDEESGRLELLLAGRIGRSAPLLSATLMATAALLLTSGSLAAGLITAGVDSGDSLLYGASLGALGLVFAGVAAVCAQLVEHARGVYAIGLGVLVVAYLLRGAGAVLDNALTWFSPLGWAEEARPFGEPRWWPVLLSVGVAALLIIAAMAMNLNRDLGSAPLRRKGAATHASGFLRSRTGFAVRIHQGAVLGWSIGAAVVCAVFGTLSDAATEAVSGNAALEDVLGNASGSDGFFAMMVLLLAILCGAYAIQATATLRAEESTGRLEATLSGRIGRSAWLGLHVAVMIVGLVIVATVGALTLATATVWSTGQASQFGLLVGAAASYLPALLVLAAIALALFAAVPRLLGLAWLVFAFTAFVMFLGDLLSLPEWLMNLAPMHHVGFPPQDKAEAGSLAGLVAVSAVVFVGGFAAFRARRIPHG